MESTSFTKIITTETFGSSSTDGVSSMSNSAAISCVKMTSRLHSSPSSSMDYNSISQPSTPTPSTPVISRGAASSPIKKVLSLDLEMRSRKRRRGNDDEGCIVYHSSSHLALRLPNLIPLEDCCHSHETCLPDTSFLRQRKPLRRRRRTII